MCGIAGYIGYPNGVELAHRANAIQRARGPDAQLVWSHGNVSLAHQRLSIIDLDQRSNQPMERDDLVIVFNGEIYNYRTLRRNLESDHGVRFRTASDTEVVLEAYRRLGPACLERFEGMFAFAIYDARAERLFLARDPFGIKPLFYTMLGGRFAFASELKALVGALPNGVVIDRAALQGALYYQWVPGEASCIAGIRKLAPAHWLTVDRSGCVETQRYWHEPEASDHALTEDDAVDALDDVLEASVERHMVADVEVGAFLSGGLDSSLVCALAAAHAPRLSTFTIATASGDKRIERMPADEKFARQLAIARRFDHHERTIDADVVTLLPQVARWLDEPIGDPAAINTYLISREARAAGIKVLLSGMGADELFFGYRRQKGTLLAQRYRAMPRAARAAIGVAVGGLPVRVGDRGVRTARWARRFLSFAELPLEAAYRASYAYYARDDLLRLFPYAQAEADFDALVRTHARLFALRSPSDPINQMCQTDIRMFMPGLNLTYTDRASMAASVEVRVPFIDKAVVELAMRIPGELKYRRGRSKHVLKRVAERHLPKSIVHRAKASFGAPIRAWISGDLAEMVGDLLSRERLEKRGLFAADVVAKMIAADRSGAHDYAYQIYQLLTIELWLQGVVDRPRCA